jgi:hypothetical protein
MAGNDEYPFTIGENFKVNWQGELFATNGTMSGKIDASSGYIDKWKLEKGDLRLDFD